MCKQNSSKGHKFGSPSKKMRILRLKLLFILKRGTFCAFTILALMLAVLISPIGKYYYIISLNILNGFSYAEAHKSSYLYNSSTIAKVKSKLGFDASEIKNNYLIDSDVKTEEELKLVDDEKKLKLNYITENTDDYYLSRIKTECGTNVSEIMALKLYDYRLLSFNDFVSQNYVVDSSTAVTEAILDINDFASKNCTIKEDGSILIYHTHSQEGYCDSDGSEGQSVVGVGDYLTQLLEAKGYEVIHDRTHYDTLNGETNRKVAYSQALEGITGLLEENPGIDVIIDLHRDSADARTVTIDGKEMCQVMLFNGLSYDQNGDITYLPNPNRDYNLAFSYQLKAVADTYYEGFMHKIYLKNYRFNMHLAEKYILAEVGTGENTLEQAMNSMEILADVLAAVLEQQN